MLARWLRSSRSLVSFRLAKSLCTGRLSLGAGDGPARSVEHCRGDEDRDAQQNCERPKCDEVVAGCRECAAVRLISYSVARVRIILGNDLFGDPLACLILPLDAGLAFGVLAAE